MPADGPPRAFDRYSFVAVTTTDLAKARSFWVDALGCRITEDRPGHHLMLDAGGLRLCLDLPDGDTHRAGGGDPVIGLHVKSVETSLSTLASMGLRPLEPPVRGARGSYARVADPDGRIVVLTESD